MKLMYQKALMTAIIKTNKNTLWALVIFCLSPLERRQMQVLQVPHRLLQPVPHALPEVHPANLHTDRDCPQYTFLSFHLQARSTRYSMAYQNLFRHDHVQTASAYY